MNTTPTLPAATRGRRRVTQDPSGDGWQVTYTCCPTPAMRFRSWTVAQRVAQGHQCPTPYKPIAYRPQRLPRLIR